ncbi:MAG: transposase [Bacteroidia bacterium]
MNVHNLIDLYTDYLLVCVQQATATGLSQMLNHELSHDKITRLLSSGEINSKTLWEQVKPLCHEIRGNQGVLILDDSIEEKRYTDCNEIIQYHFDHTVGRSVKGVNFISALYHSNDMSLPVAAEVIRKEKVLDSKNNKYVYKNIETKNELYRSMVKKASQNVRFEYVLNDTWFSSSENMNFIVKECKSHFIMALKENRKVALTLADKQEGRYVSIKSLKLEECTLSVYVEQLDFPLLICKQVFKNGDGSTGTLYLASDDVNLTWKQITTIYKKRWKVETYHKSIKSNAAFAKSPTHTPVTQISHFIASIMAFVKLEWLQVRNQQNHFAMKNQIMIKACKAAYQELKQLSTPMAA